MTSISKFVSVMIILAMLSMACVQSAEPFPQTASSLLDQYPKMPQEVAEWVANYPEILDILRANKVEDVEFILQLNSGAIVFCTMNDMAGMVQDDLIPLGILALSGVYLVANANVAQVNLSWQAYNGKGLEDAFSLVAETGTESLTQFMRINIPDFQQEGWKKLPNSNFDLPEPPNGPCKILQALTGFPCEWEVWTKISETGEGFIELVLKSGDKIIARGSMWRLVKLAGVKELSDRLTNNGTFYGAEGGWFSYIETSLLVRGLHFGSTTLRALDAVTSAVTRMYYSEPAIHVFADASDMSWGARVLKDQQYIVNVAEKLWMYRIP